MRVLVEGRRAGSTAGTEFSSCSHAQGSAECCQVGAPGGGGAGRARVACPGMVVSVHAPDVTVCSWDCASAFLVAVGCGSSSTPGRVDLARFVLCRSGSSLPRSR